MTSIQEGVYKPSNLEYAFLTCYLAQRERYPAARLPVPEYKALPDSRYRLDFAFPFDRVGIEIHGAIWTDGKYNRGAGILKAADKYNALQRAGWSIYIVHDATVNQYAAILPTILDRTALKIGITEREESALTRLYLTLYQARCVAPWRLGLELRVANRTLSMALCWELRVVWGNVIEKLEVPGEIFEYNYGSKRAAARAAETLREVWHVAQSIS